MQRRKTITITLLIIGPAAFLSIYWEIIEDPITSNDTMIFYKNSFYNNFSLVPSLTSKNKNLALALEN